MNSLLLAGPILVYALSFCHAQSPVTATPTLTATNLIASTVPSGSQQPCAIVGSLSASYAASFSAASGASPATVQIPAASAWACLKSVPIQQQDATDLVDGLSAFLAFQSTLSYLKNPPSGYQVPGTDLIGGLQSIRQKVTSGGYPGELALQTDISNLIYSAHDAHLSFKVDLLNIFSFLRGTTNGLVSIAQNHYSGLPQIYWTADVINSYITNGTASPISQIDGQPAAQWIQAYSLASSSMDPDSMYNQVFWELSNTIPIKGNPGGFVSNGFYTGDTTTLTYQNGSSVTLSNYATMTTDFTGVDSGDDFYSKFCIHPSSTSTPTSIPTEPPEVPATDPAAAPSSAAEPRGTVYPTPVSESNSGFVAGYFLDAPYSDTAVLSINSFGEVDNPAEDFQAIVSQFLQEAVSSGKTKLIVDLMNNPGGVLYLGYGTFKQLFPQVEPFGPHFMRASPELNSVGQLMTPYLQQLEANGTDASSLRDFGFTTPFDATALLDEDDDPFPTWGDMFGPQSRNGDQYTNLARFQLNNPDITGFSVSGFGNNTELPSQPFKSENIVLFTDGACDSTCFTFTNFMKSQGKVKNVVVGGRPQPGPMQGVGGVKGAEAYHFLDIGTAVYQAVNSGLLTATQLAQINSTKLSTILSLGDYTLGRAADPKAPGFNLRNALLAGDDSGTPAQFVYEAADCRIWWTRDMLISMPNIWNTVAQVVWQDNYRSCIPGSTGHPSSLSGNVTLNNGGAPGNITGGSLFPSGTGLGGAPATGGPRPTAFTGEAPPMAGMWSEGVLGASLAAALLSFALA